MKFIKLSISYMLKNFLYLFLMALIPAIFLGVLISPFKVFEFINNYSSTPILTFGTIFNGMANFSFLQILLIVIRLVLLGIFISGIIGQMENHIRSGKLNISATKEYVNSNIIVVIVNLFILAFISLFITFLASTLIFLLHLIFSGINTSPTVFNVILSNIVLSAIFIFYALICGILFINVPNMLINGATFKGSLANVIKMQEKNNFNLILAVLAPLFIVLILVSIFYTSTIMPVINTVCILLLIMYYSSLAMTGYFELSKTQRYDNKRKYYYK